MFSLFIYSVENPKILFFAPKWKSQFIDINFSLSIFSAYVLRLFCDFYLGSWRDPINVDIVKWSLFQIYCENTQGYF